jgi:hypothetical protein
VPLSRNASHCVHMSVECMSSAPRHGSCTLFVLRRPSAIMEQVTVAGKCVLKLAHVALKLQTMNRNDVHGTT